MFTGIIEHQGTVESLERSASGGRIVVRAIDLATQFKVAASIAVNGCCLTIVECTSDGFTADLSPETLRRTTFGEMKNGARVNLERPLGAGAELGGHFVQGHIDGFGRVTRLTRETGAKNNDETEPPTSAESNWWLEVSFPDDLAKYVAEKGSIAIDGVSLTIASAHYGTAAFAIIPYTYAHTNFCTLAAGDAVNVEADVLAKYVERLLDARETAMRNSCGRKS